jgi:hypothetical protein
MREKMGRGRRAGVGEDRKESENVGKKIRKGEMRGNKSGIQYRRITRKEEETDESPTVEKMPSQNDWIITNI